MRLLLFVVLILGLGFSSCKKYKLKQPAYLNFKWDFYQQDPGAFHAVVTSGYFYLDEFKVSGTRVEGPNVEILQSLPINKTTFTSGGSLGLSMDIPVGEYNEFEVELNVNDETQPCLMLFGNYNSGANLIPIRIEWESAMDLAFHPQVAFELKKKKDYIVTIGVDVQKLFSSISVNDWSEATITTENDVPTIVIRENSNNKLFTDINLKLKEALVLKVAE